jgi:hypothetical protein
VAFVMGTLKIFLFSFIVTTLHYICNDISLFAVNC